jgi:hypothetical protein
MNYQPINGTRQLFQALTLLLDALRIIKSGNKIEKDTFDAWFYYHAFQYGVSIDGMIVRTKMINEFWSKASTYSEEETIKASRTFYNDLLRSPKPAPEIIRGYFDIGPTLLKEVEEAVDGGENYIYCRCNRHRCGCNLA